MELNLTNRRVVVTGSSRGIGLGIVTSFCAEGARVVVTGRNQDQIEAARYEVGRDDTLGFCGDLTATDEIVRLFSYVNEEWGGFDILILNLGSGRSRIRLEADGDEWRRMFDLNLFGASEGIRLGAPILARSECASAVLVGSIAGLEALGAPWPYGAAKAALTHLSKQSARHLADEGIRVNLVCPGNVYFKGGTWDKKLEDDKEAVEKMLFAEVPQKRLGTVDEIAAAVTFIASPVSSFTTGANLVVDGGQTRFGA